MYIESIVFGIIIGYIRRGRIENFLQTKFTAWYLSFVALFLFVLPYLLKLGGTDVKSMAIMPFLSVVICLIIVLLNQKRPGMKMLLVGLMINIIAMGLSDFKMPVDTAKMQELGYESFVESMDSGEVINYVSVEGKTGYARALGKIIQLPKWYPLSNVLSIGDIISSIALVIVISGAMMLERRSSMFRYVYTPERRRR